MSSNWERSIMDDLAMPQNQEEYMWLHPSQCQSPSLLSESEDEDEVSVIPSTPERSPKEKRGSYSGSSVRTEFDKAHRTKKDKRQQCRVSRTIDFHPTPHPGASSAGSSDASLSPCGSAVSLSPLSSVSNRLSSSSSDTAGLLREILKEVQTSNSRVAELEKKLQSMQEEEIEPKNRKKKKLVPSPQVRSVVRTVYKTLTEGDPEFGWDLDSMFSSERNKAVAKKLVNESKVHLTETNPSTILQAAKTYFGTCCGVQKLKSSGKYNSKVISQRKKNRILRKLKNRKAALLKTSALTGEEKKKWEVVMRLDVMSSEESDSGSDSDGQNMFIKHPLPWRSDKVNSLFKSLDHKVLKGQSKRSQKMTQSRITGFSSERPQPVGLPDWAIKP